MPTSSAATDGTRDRVDPRTATSVDDLIAALRSTKSVYGNPSVRELTRRINGLRANRRGSRAIPVTSSTVGYCFRTGRRRIDHSLLFDLLDAIGVSEADRGQWEDAWQSVTCRQAPTPAVEVQTTLTAPTSRMIGREAELAEILTRPATPHAWVIEGMAGVGKSHLALHAAQYLADGRTTRYADLSAQVDGPVINAVDVMDALLHSFGIEWTELPHRLSDKVRTLSNLTRSSSALLILEDVERADQVQPLLPLARHCPILLTTRHRLGLPDVQRIALDVLPSASAHELLRQEIGAARVDAEPEAAAAMVRICGGLPLAIHTAAPTIRAKQGWTLADHTQRIAELGAADGFESAIASTYRQLSPEARRLLHRLTLHPGAQFGREIVRVIAATRGHPDQILQELLDDHLITEPAAGRYGMHQLVRGFAYQQAIAEESSTDRRKIIELILRHYIDLTSRATDALYSDSGDHELSDEAARDWLDNERTNLIGAIGFAAEQQADLECVQLAEALWPHLLATTDINGSRATQPIAAEAAQRLRDHEVEGTALRRQSITWIWSGDPIRAIDCMHGALRRARVAGAKDLEGDALNGLGVYAQMAGDLDQAIDYYREALEVHTMSGNRLGVAKACGNLAIAYDDAGSLMEAIGAFEESNKILAELGNLPGLAANQHNLGHAYREVGQLSEAVTAFQASIELNQTVGSQHNQAASHGALAVAYARAGQADLAQAQISAARELARTVREADLDACLGNEIGLTYLALGQRAEAEQEFRAAMAIAQDARNGYEENRASQCLRELGASLAS